MLLCCRCPDCFKDDLQKELQHSFLHHGIAQPSLLAAWPWGAPSRFLRIAACLNAALLQCAAIGHLRDKMHE